MADTWLVLGVSGTRKTSVSIHLTKHINSKTRRFAVSNKPYPSATRANLDQTVFESLSKNSSIVIDDLKSPTDRQSKIIRQLLVETSRQHAVRVILIAHSISHNNISQFVPHFTHILVGFHPQNRLLFFEVAKALQYDRERAKLEWQRFAVAASKGDFLMVDEGERFSLFTPSDGKNAVATENVRIGKIKQLTTDIVSALSEDSKLMIALMNYLAHTLGFNFVSEIDLTISVNTPRGRKTATLPDVLYYVTHETPIPVNVLHVLRFIFRSINIPRLFVQNKNLAKHVQ